MLSLPGANATGTPTRNREAGVVAGKGTVAGAGTGAAAFIFAPWESGGPALAPRLPTGEGGHAGEDWPQGVCTSGCSGSMRGLKWRAPLRLHTAAIADGRGVCLKLFY